MASVMAHTLDIATVAALKEGKKVTMVTKQQFLAQLMGAAEQKTLHLEKLLLPLLFRHCDCVVRCGGEADIILNFTKIESLSHIWCLCAQLSKNSSIIPELCLHRLQTGKYTCY